MRIPFGKRSLTEAREPERNRVPTKPGTVPAFSQSAAARLNPDDRYNVGPLGSSLTSSMTSAPFGAFIEVGSSAS